MKLNKTLTALAIGASFGLSGQAFAATTPAGTTISNTVDLKYTVSSVIQTPVTASSNFKVDNKIDMTVVSNTPTKTIVPGAQAIEFQYTITNEGNFAQSFALSISDAIAGELSTLDDTNTSGLNVTFFSDAAHTIQVPTVGGKQVLNLSKDAAATTVYALVDFPKTTDEAAPNDLLVDTDIIGLVMTTQAVNSDGSAISADTDANKNDVANLNAKTLKIFAEDKNVQTTPAITGEAAYDGFYLVTSAVTVTTAKFEDPATPGAAPLLEAKVISDLICKNATVLAADTVDYSSGNTACNGNAPSNYTPKALPGSQVKFTYTAKNTGGVDASDVIFTETLPAEYVPASIKNVTLNGNASTVVANLLDADATNEVHIDNINGTITLFVGPVLKTEAITITFTALIQ